LFLKEPNLIPLVRPKITLRGGLNQCSGKFTFQNILSIIDYVIVHSKIFSIISINETMHQETIIASTHENTDFMWKPYWRKWQFHLSSYSIVLHRFAGINLMEALTPKMCKHPFAIGYNLIEAPTLKMCKNRLAIGYNLILAPTLKMCKVWLVVEFKLIEALTLVEASTSFFNLFWPTFKNTSEWIHMVVDIIGLQNWAWCFCHNVVITCTLPTLLVSTTYSSIWYHDTFP